MTVEIFAFRCHESRISKVVVSNFILGVAACELARLYDLFVTSSADVHCSQSSTL